MLLLPCWRTPAPIAQALRTSRRCCAALARTPDTIPYASRDEERSIRTALHELGTQREDMKLSLKVYHFQELSRTSCRDAVLQRDKRYEHLKADLVEGVGDLSPAQLVAALVSAGRLKIQQQAFWWALARGVERHVWKTASGAPGLQYSEISLILHAIAKSKVKLKTRFYYRMLRHLNCRPELLNEFDMAWILYAMRKRKLKPKDENNHKHELWAKVTKNIAAFFGQKLHLISPRGIVYILYEFARHDVYPGRVMVRAVRRIRPHLPELSDRALVALAVLLSKFDWPEKRLLRKLSAQVQEPKRFVRMHPNMLVVIVHAYSLLGARDVGLLDAVCTRFARDVGHLDARSRATLAYALGRLGVRGRIWPTLGDKIAERIGGHPPLHLALVAHAFGKVAVRHDALLGTALPEAALEALPAFSPKQLACLLDGLTLAGYVREDLFRSALDHYIQLGSTGNWARQHMMSRVIFSAVLDQQPFLANAPPALRALMSRAEWLLDRAKERPYHDELSQAAGALSLDFKLRRRKGPYTVDLVIDGSGGGRSFAVHLAPEADYCPLTGELLGPARLREAQLQKMGLQSLHLRRRSWLSLESTEERIDALEALVAPHVRTKRRPLAALSPAVASAAEESAGAEAAAEPRGAGA